MIKTTELGCCRAPMIKGVHLILACLVFSAWCTSTTLNTQTGKTVQAAAFLGAAAASRKLKSVLIVAPATMLQHWLSELAGKIELS